MSEKLDKLKPEVKAKWLEALRSGKYEQGTIYLNADGKFCCLGVLCEVAIQQGVDVQVVEGDAQVFYDNRGSGLPDSVQDWSGFTQSLPFVGHPESESGRDVLSTLNDSDVPFTEIADLIEKYL